MIEAAKTLAHPANPAGSQQALPSEPPTQPGRIAWLFRDTLRRRQVHPLMELLRRYRDQDAT